MSEEIKNPNFHPTPEPQNAPEPPVEDVGIPAPQDPVSLSVAVPTAVTMWNDIKLMNQSFRFAKMLSTAGLTPDQYRNSPENCLIAIDISNRLGLSPMMVMQNLYIVKGKPSWSGSFCIAVINGCGRFTPLDFKFVGEPGTPSYGCYAIATRHSNKSLCVSDTVTMEMARREGWLNKPGSKWQTMPVQMMKYRAAAFFARTYCPELLMGVPTYEEVQDQRGYDDAPAGTTVITLDPQPQK